MAGWRVWFAFEARPGITITSTQDRSDHWRGLVKACRGSDGKLSMHVRWKRSTGDYVESHCGRWWITPIYGGGTRPERYELRFDNRVVGSGENQRECKKEAASYVER